MYCNYIIYVFFSYFVKSKVCFPRAPVFLCLYIYLFSSLCRNSLVSASVCLCMCMWMCYLFICSSSARRFMRVCLYQCLCIFSLFYFLFCNTHFSLSLSLAHNHVLIQYIIHGSFFPVFPFFIILFIQYFNICYVSNFSLKISKVYIVYSRYSVE